MSGVGRAMGPGPSVFQGERPQLRFRATVPPGAGPVVRRQR